MRFHDRPDAGRQLAERLDEYAHREDVIVLALPRGGVPVGAEVAAHLDAPLDVWNVRKLGAPGHSDLAMGAVAAGGIEILNAALIDDLRIPPDTVRVIADRERAELDRRERLLRRARPAPSIHERIVLLVDDGLATGATMEAAIRAVRVLTPAAVVVAVPVGAPDTCDRLRRVADRVVVLQTPVAFRAVGEWYEDFSETSDEHVRRLLTPLK